ncbi:MAG: hotdog domain-containing protein, partial [Gemmatimonadales bacterium]
MARPAKTVAESQHETSRLMMPLDENARGHVHGGVLMAMMDNTAAVCAMRHARCPCV